jgi:hypothetical protein
MRTDWSEPTPLEFHFGDSEGRNFLRTLIRQYESGTITSNGQGGLLDQIPESTNLVRAHLNQFESLRGQNVCHLIGFCLKKILPKE